jgi:cephalosporin hydroxylase
VALLDKIRSHLPYTGVAPAPAGVKRAYRRWLVDEYHKYYYCSGIWQRTSWLGVEAKQCPEDLIVLQQVIWDTKPELVVETGTWNGGTAYFFATLFDQIGEGEILTIDVDHSRLDPKAAAHPRVTTHTADSQTEETRDLAAARAAGKRTMVYLDADHSEQGVLNELRLYAALVTPGCYLVVADSNLNGHPVPWDATVGPWGVNVDRDGANGPYEAIERFLRERDDFVVDRDREYQLLTFNPSGYLKRIA